MLKLLKTIFRILCSIAIIVSIFDLESCVMAFTPPHVEENPPNYLPLLRDASQHFKTSELNLVDDTALKKKDDEKMLDFSAKFFTTGTRRDYFSQRYHDWGPRWYALSFMGWFHHHGFMCLALTPNQWDNRLPQVYVKGNAYIHIFYTQDERLQTDLNYNEPYHGGITPLRLMVIQYDNVRQPFYSCQSRNQSYGLW